MTIDTSSDPVKRLMQLINHLGYSQSKFAERLGIDQSSFSKILKGSRPFGKNMQKRVIAEFDISPDWLLYGKGEMLKDEVLVKEATTPTTADDGYHLVPLINIDSVGGIHSPNSIVPSEQYVIKNIPFTEAKEGDIAIIQSGNSMTPTIPPGSILLLREVQDWREYFGYGNIFVLWLKDDRRITKEVRRYDDDAKNYIWCVSHNPDVADEELPKSFIRGVWKVIKYQADFGW